MRPGQVVLFTEKVFSLAGIFCQMHGIAAEVESIHGGYYIVDAGLGYTIYTHESEVVLAPDGTVPKLDRFGNPPNEKLIPPHDGGI